MIHHLKALIYAAQGGNATNDTATVLRFLADRLVFQHGENSRVDYILAAHERARMLDAGLYQARQIVFAGPTRLRDRLRAALIRLADCVARSLQDRTQDWIVEITRDDPTDLPERRARFLEEALELAQAFDMTQDEAEQLVRYVFGRPPGVPPNEFGGAHLTMLALANHTGYDLEECSEEELDRCWDPHVIDRIKRKRSTRHGRGPLPGVASPVEHEPINRADLPINRSPAAAGSVCICGAAEFEPCKNSDQTCVSMNHPIIRHRLDTNYGG